MLKQIKPFRVTTSAFKSNETMEETKGRSRATIFKSDEAVHLILLCYLGDAIKCAVSVDLQMVSRNRPFFAYKVLKEAS